MPFIILIFYEFSVFPEYDKEQTAGVTGQQKMLTPDTTFIYLEVRVCSARVL